MTCCDKCKKPNCCGGCSAPCPKPCQFDLQLDPYDSSTWWINGNKIRMPKNETCTDISIDNSGATLNYNGECGKTTITGRQIGQIIKLDDLRDVEAEHPDNCSMLVWNPHCDYCAEGCTKVGAAWEPYHIPDAGDCTMEPDTEGYYHVLKKTDCGCIVECRLPVIPQGMTSLNYVRDSVPDDPDFPWYYGCYNDKINLHLQDNAPRYFGKYDLKITVHYGVQAIKSDRYTFNYNWRSIVSPGIVGNTPERRTDEAGSILQNWAAAGSFTEPGRALPWGTTSLRGSFSFIVPKGKEAYLHHEFRIHVTPNDYQYGVPAGQTWPNYLRNTNYDGKRVPDTEATLNRALWPASRLNALQVLIEPTQGDTDYDPVSDPYRNQLDEPVDDIQQPYV